MLLLQQARRAVFRRTSFIATGVAVLIGIMVASPPAHGSREKTVAEGIPRIYVEASRGVGLDGSDLYEVDPSLAGTVRRVAAIRTDDGEHVTLTDLASTPWGLLGISWHTLYRIDTQTARASVIGALGLSEANALALGPNNVLYGATRSGEFITIDPLTGKAAIIGELGGNSSGDLIVSSTGVLYATLQGPLVSDVLVTIDTATGQATEVGEQSIGFADVFGLVVVGERLVGFTFESSGCDYTGALIEIDTNLGSGSLVACLPVKVLGATSIRPSTLNYVALGDSFSSGEGVSPYDTDDSGQHSTQGETHFCHRSQWSYSRSVQADLGYEASRLFACTGAKTKHFYTSQNRGDAQVVAQLERLDETTDLITLTVGGNDVGFKYLMAACFVEIRCQNFNKHVVKEIDALRKPLQDLYTAVGQLASKARIYTLGYPQIFPDEREFCLTGFDRSERRWLRERAAQLDGVMRKASRRSGSTLGESRLVYVSTIDAFAGHELCTANPYVYGLRKPLASSYHPNKKGQRALAETLLNVGLPTS